MVKRRHRVGRKTTMMYGDNTINLVLVLVVPFFNILRSTQSPPWMQPDHMGAASTTKVIIFSFLRSTPSPPLSCKI